MAGAKIDPAKIILGAIQGASHLWISTDGVEYATYMDRGIRQSWPLGSVQFKAFLSKLHFDSGLGLLGGDRKEGLISYLQSVARQNAQRQIAIRYREEGGAIYVNMGDLGWTSIKVDGQGWTHLSNVPVSVPFVRPQYASPFPVPQKGGSINLLRKYIHTKDEESFRLLVAFIVGCMREAKEYPVLVLSGPQGSAKTTTTNLISRIIDPSFDSAARLPDNIRDLGVMARNRHLLGFDNLSYLPPKMSDAVCQLATGFTVNERMLYTNGEVFTYKVHRPVILNGIPQMVDRDDLGRRMFAVELEQVPATKKMSPDVLMAQFEQDWPFIFGAFLDAMSEGLKNYGKIAKPNVEGLVSVAHWVESAAPALGWKAGEFTAIYNNNRLNTVDSILDGDDFARIVFDTLASDGKFIGDYEKFVQVTAVHRKGGDGQFFPKDGKRFIEKLKRIMPALELKGVHVKGLESVNGKEWRDPKTRRRLVEIYKDA